MQQVPGTPSQLSALALQQLTIDTGQQLGTAVLCKCSEEALLEPKTLVGFKKHKGLLEVIKSPENPNILVCLEPKVKTQYWWQ